MSEHLLLPQDISWGSATKGRMKKKIICQEKELKS